MARDIFVELGRVGGGAAARRRKVWIEGGEEAGVCGFISGFVGWIGNEKRGEIYRRRVGRNGESLGGWEELAGELVVEMGVRGSVVAGCCAPNNLETAMEPLRLIAVASVIWTIRWMVCPMGAYIGPKDYWAFRAIRSHDPNAFRHRVYLRLLHFTKK